MIPSYKPPGRRRLRHSTETLAWVCYVAFAAGMFLSFVIGWFAFRHCH